MGFLYLRYVLNPRSIWDWLQYYIKDPEVSHQAALVWAVTRRDSSTTSRSRL